MNLESAYVAGLRLLRRGADRVGIIRALDRRRDRRWALWLRSLLAIYDVDDLLPLGVPWWTFRSADLVERFLSQNPDASVFEYGSGASTLWLAQRAGQVTFVEHDRQWMDVLRPYLKDRGMISGRAVAPEPSASPRCGSGRRGHAGLDFHDYVQSIHAESMRYNVIVIDGRARVDCLKEAVGRLKAPGVIVFDNAGRSRYREGLSDVTLPRTATRGLTPCLPYPESTLLFFTDEDTQRRVMDGDS